MNYNNLIRKRRTSLIDRYSVIIFDEKTLVILSVNKSALSFLGYRRNEMLSLDITLLFTNESAQKKLLSSRTIPFDCGIRKSDGKEVQVNVTVDKIVYENKSAKIAVITEVSKNNLGEKQLEIALTNSFKPDEKLLNNMKTPIMRIEFPGEKIIYCNSAGRKLLGYNKKEIIGNNAAILFPETETFKKMLEILETELAGNYFYDTNLIIVNKNNDEIAADSRIFKLGDEDKKLRGLLFTFNPQNQYEHDKVEIPKLTPIWESIDEAVIVTDLSGKVISWNPGAEKLYGYSPEEMIGKYMLFLIPFDKKDEFYNIISEMKNGRKIFHLETERIGKNGKRINVESTIIPVRNRSGKITNISSVTTNITYRIQLMKDLKESEKRYRDLVELSPNIMGIQQDGKIVFINSTGVRAWGSDDSRALLGKWLLRIIHPDDRLLLRDIEEQLFDGKQVSGIELRIIKSDGSILFLEVSAKLFIYLGKIAVQFIANDITQRKNIESERKKLLNVTKEYASELNAVFESIPDAVFMGNELEIKKANKKCLEMFGFQSLSDFNEAKNEIAEIMKMKDFETDSPLLYEDTVFAKALKGNSVIKEIIITDPGTGKDKIIRAAGAPIFIGEKIIAAVVINSDITQKKQNEKVMIQNEGKYKSLIEQSFDGIALIRPNGKIMIWNSKLTELLGFNDNEILEVNFNDLFTEEVRKWASDGDISKNVGKTLRYESKVMRKNGSYFPAEISIRVLENKLIMWVIRNISHRKAAEEMHDKLFNKLIEAQNLMKTLSRRLIQVQESERRQLARELHDEIGQTLTALKIDLVNAVRSINSADVKKQINDGILLVEDTLNDIRRMALNLRPSMLDDLGLIPAIRWYIGRQVQRVGLNIKIITEPVEEKFSPELQITCYRIIQESINNVIKYANAKNVIIELYKKANELHLNISDDGIGYNVSAARKRAISGESLGILGMQERAELLGGWLDINSSANKGTNISAIFPLKTQEIK